MILHWGTKRKLCEAVNCSCSEEEGKFLFTMLVLRFDPQCVAHCMWHDKMQTEKRNRSHAVRFINLER